MGGSQKHYGEFKEQTHEATSGVIDPCFPGTGRPGRLASVLGALMSASPGDKDLHHLHTQRLGHVPGPHWGRDPGSDLLPLKSFLLLDQGKGSHPGRSIHFIQKENTAPTARSLPSPPPTVDRDVAHIAHPRPSRTHTNAEVPHGTHSSTAVTPHSPGTDAGGACRPRRAADTLRFVHLSSQPVSS